MGAAPSTVSLTPATLAELQKLPQAAQDELALLATNIPQQAVTGADSQIPGSTSAATQAAAATAAAAPATEAAAEAAAPSAVEAAPATEGAAPAPAGLTPVAPPDTKPITNGWDAQANKPIIVGYAPLAPRPDWLPKTGPGQKNVVPLCWSLSVEQWIFFVRACVATDTWKKLAEVKGEYEITMYDVNDHFVKPWTQGTGCSIALLMNTAEQLPVEGMFSHAWAGSVVETYNCLQNMVNHSGVPSTARFFFCTFSMYQPQDSAAGGLSISEQIALEPFAKIIESKPTHGMFVLHTTVSEVYDRLWVAHEADVGIDAKLQMRGLFDMYRWTVEKFESAAAVKTCDGKVGVEKDRAYIEGLIMTRGGYERLDGVIAEFRKKMLVELKVLLEQPSPPLPPSRGSQASFDKSENWVLDWKKFDWSIGTFDVNHDYNRCDVVWMYRDQWKLVSDCMLKSYDVRLMMYPSGTASYPLGAPLSRVWRHGWSNDLTRNHYEDVKVQHDDFSHARFPDHDLNIYELLEESVGFKLC